MAGGTQRRLEGIHTFHLSFHYGEAYSAADWFRTGGSLGFCRIQRIFQNSAGRETGKKTFRAVSAPDTHYFRTDSAVPEGQIPLYRAGTAPRALRRQTQAGTSPSGNRYTEAGSIPAERSAERGCYLHGHPPDRLQRNPYRRTVCPEMGRYQF